LMRERSNTEDPIAVLQIVKVTLLESLSILFRFSLDYNLTGLVI
jgi:hypothetical protein